MQVSVSADKYVNAYKRVRVKPVTQKWTTQNGACPLYVYGFYQLHKLDESVKIFETQKILTFIRNRFGIDYRNGFTGAIDGLSIEYFGDEVNPHFLKGYEDGEYVKKKLEL